MKWPELKNQLDLYILNLESLTILFLNLATIVLFLPHHLAETTIVHFQYMVLCHKVGH